jgi:hypothetical protein
MPVVSVSELIYMLQLESAQAVVVHFQLVQLVIMSMKTKRITITTSFWHVAANHLLRLILRSLQVKPTLVFAE